MEGVKERKLKITVTKSTVHTFLCVRPPLGLALNCIFHSKMLYVELYTPP